MLFNKYKLGLILTLMSSVTLAETPNMDPGSSQNGPLKLKTREWGSQFDDVKTMFGEITNDRTNLLKIRTENTEKFNQLSAQGVVDMQSFLKEVDSQNKKFVHDIIDQEVKAMGIDPKTFSVFTMGSMARCESGLYTDLEVFFVVNEKTVLMQYYMEHLAQRLADRFFRLGEHPDVGGKGMRVDEAGNSPFHLHFASRYMNPDLQGKVMREAIANRDFKAIPFEGCHMMLVTPEELSQYHDVKFTKQLLEGLTQDDKIAMKEKRKAAFWEAYNALRSDPAHAHKLSDGKSEDELYKQLNLCARHLYDNRKPKEAKHAEDLGMRLMRNVAPIYDKGGMFDEYWTKREEILNSPATENPDKYESRRQEIAAKLLVSDGLKYATDPSFNMSEGKLGEMIDLKRELYRIPEQILTNLGFYYNVGTQNVIDIIQSLKEKGVFDDAFAGDVKDLMNFAMQLNVKQQALMKKQAFDIYISQSKYDSDMKELKVLETNAVKKIEILKIADASTKDLQKAEKELAEATKNIHDLEGVAPGKILTDAEVNLLSTKYIPMLKALYDKAFAWAGKEGDQVFKGSLHLTSTPVVLESAPVTKHDKRAMNKFEGPRRHDFGRIFKMLDELRKAFAAPAA